MGDSSTATSIHTLSNINYGTDQPWITVRSQMTGNTDPLYISAKGAKVQSVDFTLNLLSDWPYMTEGISYNAIKTEAADHAAAYTPVIATDDYLMNGTQRSDWYVADTNTVFTWDGDDFVSSLAFINASIIQHHKLGFRDNQTELEFIKTGKFQFLFNISFVRGDCSEIWTDYLAGGQKTMVFKIFNNKTSDYYRQYTWTNATITKVNAPYTEVVQDNIWGISGFAEDLEVKVKDGVSDSFYDD
jgi:hypothetical protein